jgi:hypothetical protein
MIMGQEKCGYKIKRTISKGEAVWNKTVTLNLEIILLAKGEKWSASVSSNLTTSKMI